MRSKANEGIGRSWLDGAEVSLAPSPVPGISTSEMAARQLDSGSGRRASRRQLNQVRVSAPDTPAEASHLYRCMECRQLVNRRSLGDVLWHGTRTRAHRC